ncbi:ABC transporter permease [Parasalinivibrio latis]|uniref:ABC transporter permease n=1 Tax=Parasalinivibrio latis TaxID=2952610 RepID=UPI0030E488B5
MMESIYALLDQNEIFNSTTILHYWDGLTVTVQLVFLSLVIGLVLSVPLAVARTSKNPWINRPVWFYVYVFRGTPLLIQLYIIYYGVATIEGIQDSMFWAVIEDAFYPCLLAFVLNTAAYTTEILRGAIMATSHGEIEAGKAYGMSPFTIMRRIILPSAFRRALPAYSNEVIFMLHASSIASVVTIIDLTGAARDIYARFYAPFDAFLFVAAIYLCLTFTIVYAFKRLEGKWHRHLRPLETK